MLFFYGSNGFSAFAQNTEMGGETGGFTNYQNTPVNSILDIYEHLSGKHLIRDVSLNNVPAVSLNATGVNKAEMLKLIEATLLLNGVSIIQVDDTTAKVISLGNKNPRAEGIKLFANAEDLPANDEIVSYYMPLSYIGPNEAQQIFSQSSPVHNYGSYVPAPSANAIIITENASTIRQLIAMKELVDVPPARVESEFIPLKRADASTVADLLNKLLDQKSSGPNGGPGGNGGQDFVPWNVGNTAPLLNEHHLVSGYVQIVPDTRSNRLLIITRPGNMPFLKELIAQLDQPDNFMTPQRRELRYVLAENILPALEMALAVSKDEEDEVNKNAKPPTTTSTGNGTQSQPSTSSAATASGVSGSTTTSVTSPLSAPTENDVPTVVTIGKTKLMADDRTNSIIVFGSPDIVTQVFRMIDELDQKPLQVYLATVIGQLTLTRDEQFGVDLLQKFQTIGNGGLASSSLTPGTAGSGSTTSSSTGTTVTSLVPEPSSLVSSTGFPLISGLTLYGAIGSTLNAYVRALETTNQFKVISRPSVYTSNNKLAVIASGSSVPVPSNITSGFVGTGSSLTTTASVSYENVLLQLEIIPLINADHQITLKIRQTNNTLGSNNVISGNNVPTILTQEINTEVTVANKSTVVIGGLISDTTSRDTSGVPWLGDIPLLGYLFKDTTKDKERDELIIMIQPTVVETETDQIAVDQAEKQRTLLGKEAEQAAGGQFQVLPQQSAAVRAVPSASAAVAYNSKLGSAATQTTVPYSSKYPAAPAASPSSNVPPSTVAPSSVSPDVGNGQMPKNLPPPTPMEP
ncbi:MAG TPA: secretin N-terminal domain-containing protein [Candidatus Methylacidiphilales bacterium]|nr:secretin N-terminal domain-containing protein [Candidatus Methylacidiphilales bacterium]